MTKIKDVILGKDSNGHITRIVFLLPFLFFVIDDRFGWKIGVKFQFLFVVIGQH